MMPGVSVIIPTYSHQDFVLATLDSVFAQTFTDYEVIVVNDGSPDDTAEVLRPLAEAGRIRYIQQQNQGQSAARNRGIAEAQGEFIALLDDDDLWPPDKLEWQVQLLRENADAVLVYGGVSLVDPQFERERDSQKDYFIRPEKPDSVGNAYKEFFIKNPTLSPGQTLIRTAAIKQIQGFDPNIWGADDYDLYIRLARLGDFIFQRRRALFYRMHAENASKNFRRHYRNVCTVRRKHLGQYPFSSDNQLWLSTYSYWHETFINVMLTEVGSCITVGDKPRGRQIWKWALLLLPKRYQLRRMISLARQLV